MTRKISVGWLAAVLAVGGCSAPVTQPEPLPAAPQVVAFNASAARVTAGATISLSWQVRNAVRVELEDSVRGQVPIDATASAGQVSVQVASSTLFTLLARNARGVTDRSVVSVVVDPINDGSLVLTANPQVVEGDEPVRLVWLAPNAQRVSLSDGTKAVDVRAQTSAGEVEVRPTSDETTYTLTADGRTTTVRVVRRPEIRAATATPAQARSGATVTLGWSTAFARSLQISLEGSGLIQTVSEAARVAQGTLEVTLPAGLVNGTRVIYRVVAQGPGGEATANVGVVIGTAPRLLTVTAPQYAFRASRFNVSWTSTNADELEVRQGAVVLYRTRVRSEVAAGTVELTSPDEDVTYLVVARDRTSGNEDSRSITLSPVGSVSVSRFSASASQVDGGCAPVTLTWLVPSARRLRIVEDGQLTVHAVEGRTVESGSITVYPNSSTTTYELLADNTLEAEVRATTQVTVLNPARLVSFGGGAVLQDFGAARLDWAGCPGGVALSGVPAVEVDTVDAGASTFVDIAQTGTAFTLSNTDTGTAAVALPQFETFLWGQRRSGSWTVSVNGHVTNNTFNTTLNTIPDGGMPSASTSPPVQAFQVAPLWADLELGANGRVLWQLTGSAPDRTLVLQWDKVVAKGRVEELTFQARISQNGEIAFEYATMPAGVVFPAAIGVQGPFAGIAIGNGVRDFPQSGTRHRFYQPRPAGASPVSTVTLPITGLVRVGSGYARVPLSRFVRAGALRFAEVMIAPAPAVVAGEWVEIRNASNETIDLQGFVLDFGSGVTHTVATPLPVAPGGVVVLGQTKDTSLNDGVTVDYEYGQGITMPDSNGTLALRRGADTVQTLTWTTLTPGVAALVGNETLFQHASTRTLVTLSCAATSTYGSQPTRQRGSPGRPSTCFGYDLLDVVANYRDISQTGTLLPLSTYAGCTLAASDEGITAQYSLGGTLDYFGTTVSGLIANANGWMSLGSPPATPLTPSGCTIGNPSFPTLTASPSSANLLSVFWDDLETDPLFIDAGIYAQRFTAGQDATEPRPHWIIQWHRFRPYVSSTDRLNFQVKLFETGDIEYHFGTMTGTAGRHLGDSATVWLGNAANTFTLPYSVNSAAVTPNSAIRFRRAAP